MIGFWLLPEEAAQTWFALTIAELAQKYGGPVFQPHVTLFVDGEDEKFAATIATRVALTYQPIVLSIEGLAYSDKFTRTLYVRFERNETAQHLANLLSTEANCGTTARLDPHVSLLYADITTDEKAAEAARIQLPFREVKFNAIQVMRFRLPIRTRAEVEAWRTLAKAELRG